MHHTRIRYPLALPIGNIPLQWASGCGGGAHGDDHGDVHARGRGRGRAHACGAKEAEKLGGALG